ncbi:MAG: LamG domain-containing protein [Candidatus Pacebacteria bacterium]|nr:LamG domain-containing protein [Candidatus Paceibacterota bacterium]
MSRFAKQSLFIFLSFAILVTGALVIWAANAGGNLKINPYLGHDLDLNAAYYAQAANNTVHDITTQDISISAWVKMDTDSSGTMYILSKYFPGYALYLVNNAVDAVIRDAEDTYQIYRSSGVEIRDNKWHHLAAVFDRDTAGNCRVFIDGQESGETVRTGTLANIGSISNASTLAIGRRSGSTSNYLDGQVRDVKLYYASADHWTDSQILYQYQHPFDYTGTAGTTGSLTDYWRCDEGSETTLYGKVNNLTLSSASAWSIQPKLKNNPSSTAKVKVSTGLVGYWKLDDDSTSSTSVIDYSGKGNTGTAYSSTATTTSVLSTTTAQIGRAMYFDGVNDRVYGGAGDSFNFSSTNKLTVSAWVKMDADTGTNQTISGNWSYHRFLIKPTLLYFGYWNTAGIEQIVSNTYTFDLNQWYYVAVTVNDNVVTKYINGVRSSDSPAIKTGTIKTGNHGVYIGAQDGNAYWFSGLIDDVRIYNYARSAEQILQDYQRGLNHLP